jgi:hypothetical protein
MGIEPTLAAWEAAVLPLNYTRETNRVSAISTPSQCLPPPGPGVHFSVH